MNKIVQQLAEQAEGTKKHVPAVWQFYDHELEKFVELIVLQCADVSERTGILNDANFAGGIISDAIKEHFGVEK